MSDNDDTRAEQSLRKLGELLEAGMKQQYPLNAQERQCVRDSVRIQWERKEAVRQSIRAAREEALRKHENQQEQEEGQNFNEAEKKQQQDNGHGH